MNECFVNIKVDKEERPDVKRKHNFQSYNNSNAKKQVDKVYMQYLQATKQGSGWPVSIW